MSQVEFRVNGKVCKVNNSIDRNTTLNAYIRNVLFLSGSKSMCLEGACGACVVAVRARRSLSGLIETFAVNSCLVLVFSCNGWEITTIEGLGNRLEGYSELQQRIAKFNGTQCGYCTPGFLMSLHSLLDKHPGMTMAELETSFGSNTCRCTGYRPILDTIKSFAIDASHTLCQRVQDIEDLKICSKTKSVCKRKCSISEGSDWSILSDGENVANVHKFGATQVFVNVYTVEQIFDTLRKYGTDSYMLVDGNTGKGIQENFEYRQVLIDISDVDTLKQYHFDQNLVLGANISLEDCIKIFRDTAESRIYEFAYLAEMAKHFEMIANIPVRNIGSLAGNLMVKHEIPSFQSDVFVLFSAVDAMITIRTINGQQMLLTMKNFLKFNMTGVLIVNILLPPLNKSYVFRSYKIMPRNQNATASVNAAFLLKINDLTKIIEDANIIYGNIRPDFINATQTENFLKGRNIFDNKNLQTIIKVLNAEIIPDTKPLKPTPECRKKLAIGLFYKFILSISPPGLADPRYRSGGTTLTRPLSHGTQDFQTDPSLYPLNEPLLKNEALIQSSGEVMYTNDMPPIPNEVFGAFVLSTIHAGELDQVDTVSVLEIPGVVTVLTAKDIPGKNSYIVKGITILLVEEEEMLVSTNVKYYGQPVAIVVAETQQLAENVAKKVKVSYKNISAKLPVLTIDEAKKDSTRIKPHSAKIEPKSKGTNVQTVINGVYEVEGQYHYYLEPITSVVIPVDEGLEVHDATQWMDVTQAGIAQCLGIKESDVVVKVRRLGGGFGGKLTPSTLAVTACALVAKTLDRPCRFILPMKTNMAIGGKRLPGQYEYEVGVDDVGKIQYLNASMVEDKGATQNDNTLDYTINGFKNCYNYDCFSVKTATIKTDLPTNTFMRAPGNAQGIASIEYIMEHIAHTLKKDVDDVRMINLRSESKDIQILLEQVKKEANYQKRSQDIELFNKSNRWTKKAIQTCVMDFLLSYEGIFSAMISIYKIDGTITVTTGGIEMGQGINTKAKQVCAYELGVPVDTVTVISNYSFAATNNALTARSVTSESVCFAIIKACAILKERLQPMKEKMPLAPWKELVSAASNEGIDLVAHYTMSSKDPDLSSYNAYGVAIIEVQLDVLTGRFQILRTDIIEDVGLSLNPLIDIGQVEGAFVQGLGYYTSEKLIYDKYTGKLLTNRSLHYHVPSSLDIPADFRVKLRYNSRNPKGVLGSKAVGEMGVCLSYGITHALRKCIYASRKDSGYDTTEWINIDVPYTTDSILKALEVRIEEMVFNKKK
ncbi:uncharacterized protein LOC126373277 [Pectinophora gossypiella]|uniref:uncharacterized protein LOC126373277 n=1 Tax=Pectinophora gossypiella TaxID=13191 RepID=UPI00214E4508|nr:uncharacterized protein LOC126373277 [Pectinophora gossypiella]